LPPLAGGLSAKLTWGGFRRYREFCPRYQKGNAVSTTTSAQPAQLTRNERLDRLPFNKAHRKLLVASGVGWAFDAMDVGLVSFAAAFILACIAALCLPERKGLNLED
jgi:putative MFS transporter